MTPSSVQNTLCKQGDAVCLKTGFTFFFPNFDLHSSKSLISNFISCFLNNPDFFVASVSLLPPQPEVAAEGFLGKLGMVHVTKIQNIKKKLIKNFPKLLPVKFSQMPLLTTLSLSSVPPPLTPPAPHSPALPLPLLCVTTSGSPLHTSCPCLYSPSPCPTQLCPQPQRAPWCRVPNQARGTVGLQT